MDSTYNGWVNYETWVTNLWFSESIDFTTQVEEGMFNSKSKGQIILMVADWIEEFIVEDYIEMMISRSALETGFIHDMLGSSLKKIDYLEIAEHYVDDIIELREELFEEEETLEITR